MKLLLHAIRFLLLRLYPFMPNRDLLVLNGGDRRGVAHRSVGGICAVANERRSAGQLRAGGSQLSSNSSGQVGHEV